MEEDGQDNKQTVTTFSRYRSPTFSRDEIKTLINLVEKFKIVVQNKATNTTACQAKELAWRQISKLFNSQGFKHKRSAESLKGKWDNLKKEARKLSKNLIGVEQEEVDEITVQIVALMNDAECLNDMLLPEELTELKEAEEVKEMKGESENTREDNGDIDLHNTNGNDEGDIRQRRMSRSMNFTPQEVSLLLKCVKAEKKYVFNLSTTGKAIKMKNRAWFRITQSYNKLSTQKRSTKVLRTKFSNMRRMTKRADILGDEKNKEHLKLEDSNINNVNRIKLEPEYESGQDSDSDRDNDSRENDDYAVDSRHNDDDNGDNFSRLHANSNHVDLGPDPLSVVLNSGDSGIDSINIEACQDNKEIIKLKTQLLQYQLETAKLERRRIEAAMQAESEANQAKAIEAALRLRTARLEAITAAMKLPHGHNALQYPPEESRAQSYLTQYHQT